MTFGKKNAKEGMNYKKEMKCFAGLYPGTSHHYF